MNKFFVLSTIVFSIFFFACEDDTIPIPLPPSQPSADAPGGENTEKSSEPAKVAKSSAKEKPPAKAKEAPAPKTVVFDGDAEQLKTGRYIIQVGIFPTEASARKIIKKLAESGIKAYNAKVDNPDPEKGMIGTYNRVRIGFFAARNAAESFAKTRLEPLGYSWWIDRSKNDNVGKLAYSESEPVFEVERIERPKQMSEQERRDAERAAAIAAAKEEYRAIAKAANASVTIPPPSIPPKASKAAPPPPAPKAPPPKLAAPKASPPTSKAAPPPVTKAPAPEEQTAKEAEIDNRGKVKMKRKKQ